MLFVINGPLAPKALPDAMVLSLDLRQVPKEASSGGGVLHSLLHDDRGLTDTVQLLWQAADDPRVVGLYVEVGDDDAGLARVQELRDAISRFRAKGKFAIGFAEELGGNGDHFADYYLASSLDQIWMQPSGGFQVMGLAVEIAVPARRARQARRQGRGRQALGIQERARHLHRDRVHGAGAAEPAAAARQPLCPVHQ